MLLMLDWFLFSPSSQTSKVDFKTGPKVQQLLFCKKTKQKTNGETETCGGRQWDIYMKWAPLWVQGKHQVQYYMTKCVCLTNIRQTDKHRGRVMAGTWLRSGFSGILQRQEEEWALSSFSLLHSPASSFVSTPSFPPFTYFPVLSICLSQAHVFLHFSVYLLAVYTFHHKCVCFVSQPEPHT